MKYLKTALLLLCISMLSTALLAQDKKTEKKERVIIIHESDDGEETRQEIIIEHAGEEGKKAILKINGEEIDIDEDFEWIDEEVGREVEKAMKEVEVELKKMEDGLNELHLRYIDENGEEQTLDWKGKGQLPEELQQDLEEKGVYFFDSDNAGGQEVEVIVKNESNKKVVIIKDQKDEREDLMEWAAEQPRLELEDFEAYPNPASELLKLQFKAEAAPVNIRMFDKLGKTVFKEKLKNFDGHYEREIGLQGIPEGTLILVIEQNDKVYTEKVMLRRM